MSIIVINVIIDDLTHTWEYFQHVFAHLAEDIKNKKKDWVSSYSWFIPSNSSWTHFSVYAYELGILRISPFRSSITSWPKSSKTRHQMINSTHTNERIIFKPLTSSVFRFQSVLVWHPNFDVWNEYKLSYFGFLWYDVSWTFLIVGCIQRNVYKPGTIKHCEHNQFYYIH